MNILFSSSKTLRVEGLNILDEEAISFTNESSMEEEGENNHV